MSEGSNGGTDTVIAGIDWTLGANIERLVLEGGAALDGLGNILANTMTCTAGANSLNGAGGNDTLSGGLGNDTLSGGAGSGRDERRRGWRYLRRRCHRYAGRGPGWRNRPGAAWGRSRSR